MTELTVKICRLSPIYFYGKICYNIDTERGGVPFRIRSKGGITVKITYAGKNKDFSSDFTQSAEKKLKKFDRFFDDATAQIKTERKKNGESVELTIYCGGTIYRSEKKADTLNNALDEAIEAIERQIRRNKTRLSKRLKTGAFKGQPEPEAVETAPEAETPEFKVRTKHFPVKPMTTEDAILQMLLLEHDFFLFRSVETGELNVVYKKTDGNFGLIIPE